MRRWHGSESQVAESIQYEKRGNIATIWLNRPTVRNCIDMPMLEAFAEAITSAEEDNDVRAVVVRGRGGTFCAGADLRMLSEEYLGTSSASIRLAVFSAKTYDRLFSMAKPTIAVVEGYAVAGGFELMISCDFALAADDAQIGDYHIRRAVFGGAGPIYRLPRYIGIRRAKELLLSGKLLSGVKAAEWGLVNASGPQAELGDLVDEFVQPLTDKSPFVTWITKLAANRGLDGDTETLMVLEHMACNVVHHSDDAKEGVQAFLEKRPPEWKGQ